MKTKYIILIVLITFIVLYFGFVFLRPLPIGRPFSARIGESVNVSIQTPHPYPNSESGKTLVWSETIEHLGATFIRLHFSRIDIAGEGFESPTVYEEVDYGECDLNAPPGYTREWDGKNTITQKQIVEDCGEGAICVGSLSVIKCGVAQEKKEFTPQELFGNYENWSRGDFVVVRNDDGIVIDVIHGRSYGRYDYEGGVGVVYKKEKEDVWSKTYWDTNKITLELYADKTENGFGLYIDRYIRGFTEEEIEEANSNRGVELEEYERLKTGQ